MDKLGEVRDLGFLSWKDPDAWMEQMKGPRWNTLVREENKRLQETIKKYVEPVAKRVKSGCFFSFLMM